MAISDLTPKQVRAIQKHVNDTLSEKEATALRANRKDVDDVMKLNVPENSDGR